MLLLHVVYFLFDGRTTEVACNGSNQKGNGMFEKFFQTIRFLFCEKNKTHGNFPSNRVNPYVKELGVLF